MRPLAEQLLSDSRLVRALITQRSDGLYEVEVAVFVKGSALDHEPSWWSPIDGAKMVTDSLERARELAREGMVAVCR